MVPFVDALPPDRILRHPNHAAACVYLRLPPGLIKCAALGAEIVHIKVVNLAALPTPNIPHKAASYLLFSPSPPAAGPWKRKL